MMKLLMMIGAAVAIGTMPPMAANAAQSVDPCSLDFKLLATRRFMLDNEIVLESGFTLPLLRPGFRMVVFSIVIMVVVLFFRKGIMGDKELPDLLNRRPKKQKKESEREY